MRRRRARPHTRDVVMVTPDGERTIVVVGEPLHPSTARYAHSYGQELAQLYLMTLES